MWDLTGKQIAIVVGHEPGGGAAGERTYNLTVASMMKSLLTNRGAKVYVHFHREKSYGTRQRQMAAAVRDKLPNCDACIELHYNAFSNPTARGHEFFYLGSKRLAECVRDEFQKRISWSRPRRENGIEKKTGGDGHGFLLQAPAWAVLVEPFFQSNKDEKEFFAGKHYMVASIYSNALANFILNA